MKICRIVDFFPTGKEILGDLGPNYYHYATGMTNAGFEEHIICMRKPNQPKYEQIEGINICRVSSSDVKHPRRDMLFGEFARNSFNEVMKIKPDIVHGHNSIHYAIAKQKTKLASKNIKLITHLHILIDMYSQAEHFPFNAGFTTALRDRLLDYSYFRQFMPVVKNADLIIACDNSTKHSVERHFKNKHIDVIYNGVDTDKFKHIESNLKEKFQADKLLLNISRPVPWKGIQYLIRAMPYLNSEFKDLKCLLLGVERPEYQIYLSWLKSIAKKLNLNNIEFAGRVPYYDLPDYYSAADCFVAPSYPDPSPKTVYEAQACNCPVVGANGSGIPEIFSQESGLLFEPRNPRDLADKISEVLNNPAHFKGGRKTIIGKATWTKCVSEMIKSYEKLCS